MSNPQVAGQLAPAPARPSAAAALDSSAAIARRHQLFGTAQVLDEVRQQLNDVLAAARDCVAAGCPCSACERLRAAVRAAGGAA